ncbi:MAG: hypothetical protein ACK5U4_19975, partial [Rhodospirillales bacterium]
MNNDLFQLAHYAVSVIGFVVAAFMFLMRSQFVTQKDFEALKQSTEDRFKSGSEKMADLKYFIGRVEVDFNFFD